jgi:hypothetical protein
MGPTHHRGPAEVYLRLKNIKPPSLLRGDINSRDFATRLAELAPGTATADLKQ